MMNYHIISCVTAFHSLKHLHLRKKGDIRKQIIRKLKKNESRYYTNNKWCLYSLLLT